jgi:hypothetical protein
MICVLAVKLFCYQTLAVLLSVVVTVWECLNRPRDIDLNFVKVCAFRFLIGWVFVQVASEFSFSTSFSD